MRSPRRLRLGHTRYPPAAVMSLAIRGVCYCVVSLLGLSAACHRPLGVDSPADRDGGPGRGGTDSSRNDLAGSPGGAGTLGGGAGATGSDSAAAGSTGGQTPAAVRIIRGDPAATGWLTLTIEGHGLSNLDGRLVTARIGTPDHRLERLGSGQALISNGTFRIIFPNGWERSLYKQKAAFIDMDADGICTPGFDQVFGDWRAATTDVTLTIPGSVPAVSPWDEMVPSSDCSVLNGPWPDS